ncbi:MAG: ABC transporter permease [Cypionkella sp.]
MTPPDLTALTRDIPDIVSATPTSAKGQTVVLGELNHTVAVTGTDNAYFDIRGWTLAYGSTFSESELRTGASGR